MDGSNCCCNALKFFATPEISNCEVILSIIVQLGTYWLLQGSRNSTMDFLYVGNVNLSNSGIILALGLFALETLGSTPENKLSTVACGSWKITTLAFLGWLEATAVRRLAD
jgi:hypothetical protein